MEVGLSIAQMQRGMDVEGFYLLKAAFAKVTASGKPFLSAVLADTSGTIEAKVWDYSGPIGERDVGKVLKVRGSVSDYRGMPQLTVDKLRLAEDNDRVDVSKLVSVAPIDREAGYDEVKALVSTIEDADYRAMCEEMLRRHEAAFRTIPAAKSVHHGFLSGLLMHTLNMLRLADFLSAQYADTVNRSLLLTGTLLHDFAKEQEFTFSELGLVTDYSTKGQLLGHLVMGAQEVAAIAAELDLPEEKATLLEHLILSHHGQPEFGAAVLPQCAEAELLSLVDQIDSRMEIYREVLAPLKAGEFSQRVFALDNRRVYKQKSGWQRQRRCTAQRGRYSIKRESPPMEPPRERQGAFRFRPLHPLTTNREGRSPSFLDYPPRSSDGAALLRSPLRAASISVLCCDIHFFCFLLGGDECGFCVAVVLVLNLSKCVGDSVEQSRVHLPIVFHRLFLSATKFLFCTDIVQL